MRVETKAIVLDYLPYGKTGGKKIPIIYGLGKNYLTLMEIIKPKNLEVTILEEIPIITRYKIIKYNQLSETGKINLKKTLENLIDKEEKLFIEFINKSIPITPRLHMLELLPHIGKKTTWEIIKEKEKKPFESFEDLKNRIKTTINIKKAIVERIISEYEGKDKYKLFVGSTSFLSKLISTKE